MDEVYMRYNIENDLKHYERALEEISKGGEKYIDEALALIKK